MLTVSQLARLCGLSRTTLLYYESIGLLAPAGRSESNYRRYTTEQLERLRGICAYRDAGLRLSDIRQLLDEPSNAASTVLQRRLLELDREIETLREHQNGHSAAVTGRRWQVEEIGYGVRDEQGKMGFDHARRRL